MVNAAFVYGTLKTGECRSHVFGEYLKGGFTLVKGTIKAELFDLGPYPGILKGEDTVYGELVVPNDEREMRLLVPALDRIEGYYGEGERNLYNREVVTVSTPDGDVEASTYFFGDDKRLRTIAKYLPDGVWGKECTTKRTTGAGA